MALANGLPPTLFTGSVGGDDGHVLTPLDDVHLHYSPIDPAAANWSQWRVRRLMPVECERLQGMPDHYTQVPYRGRPAADAPRYKAIGNSMAVPCIAWVGERLLQALSQSGR
ncbi:DNA cytosine methyltransferase [Chitinimonas koreensis]|uniref:DNA cytosine methyltransferase n=1 Tax=Chitinimonas koreensis TaxID=356302 RepID=UPI0004242549